ncbi:MAG: hypothetical protein OEM76_15530, partial [Gammaproteobacteria bacterium]|nr:hypothetical protein [Gammaproteobacteria bacterium]
MKKSLLQSLSMTKYERLLPRIFPGADRLEIRDLHHKLIWQLCATAADERDPEAATDDKPVVDWSDFGPGVERRQLPDGQMEFRATVQSRQFSKLGYLIAGYHTQPSVPMSTAPDSLRRAFLDALAFLQEELELQLECNQLAVELTERYEELNLVYSTQDQVVYLEEGQEALVRLVNNCADYLDVGLAALVCRDRNLVLHSVNA